MPTKPTIGRIAELLEKWFVNDESLSKGKREQAKLIIEELRGFQAMNTRTNKTTKEIHPMVDIKAFCIVVTDGKGNRFIRRSNKGVIWFTHADDEEILHDGAIFVQDWYAKKFLQDTIERVKKYEFIKTEEPYKAEVVPLIFKIG